MNFKFLVLGAAIGFAIAAAPSCGGSTCGPNNCGGCCSSSGTCIARTDITDSACGTQGVTCSNCTTTSGTCNKTSYSCQGGTGTGTGGGSASDAGGTGGGTATVDSGTNLPADGTIVCNVATQNCPAGTGECLYIDSMGNGRCFQGECDLIAQNCSGVNKCSYGIKTDGGVGRTCQAPGTTAEGAACGATGDDCAKGLLCVNAKCVRLCNTTTNCGLGALCQKLVQVPNSAEVPAFCDPVEMCNPLAQACTKPEESCYPTQAGDICLATGTAAIGAACGNVNCVRGAVCLIQNGAGACKAMCSVDGGAPACGGAACAALQSTTEFGICL